MKLIQGTEQEYADYVAKNSSDGYGKGVVDYAERWADLMEKRMPLNVSPEVLQPWFKENAGKLSHDADTEGITGFMYGCAVSALSHFWVYGDLLRRWHNLKTQIGDEGVQANESGGTLNPALLNLG